MTHTDTVEARNVAIHLTATLDTEVFKGKYSSSTLEAIEEIITRELTTLLLAYREELQKAQAEMLHKLHLCAIGKYEGDALENVKAQIKEYQSELDQPIS